MEMSEKLTSMTTEHDAKTKELEADDPSAIDHIAVDEAKGDALMYDLSGRKIQQGHKGLVIQNGKKILVK